jgi:diguanylate cyclase (GGDEF)-like protein
VNSNTPLTHDLGTTEDTGLSLVRLTAELQSIREELDATIRLASHDALTGLPNRRTITERLADAVDQAAGGGGVAVMFIDVDRFKVINDLYGHEVGDRVLREVAERIRSALGDDDEVGRLGGDEFVVVVHDATADRVARVAASISDAVGPTVDVGHRTLPLTVSLGVAIAHREHVATELLDRADAAMYRAKRSGRAAVVHFDEEMEQELTQRSQLERDLTHALQDGQLTVHYQPTVRVGDGRIVGFEAFVRWLHPTMGVLPAQRFVPLAEDVGQVWAIDAFVLGETGRRAAAWQAMHPSLTDLVMSVNLSSQQFRDQSVISTVRHAVETSGVRPSTFQLEVSEATLMDPRSPDPETLLHRLHQLGVRLAIDNFGTGSSSLSCLRQLPLDVLNIDRRFIAGLGTDRDDEVIVRAVLHLATAFDVDAVAEGVETDAQRSWLTDAGCRLAQGFLFSAPVDADGAEQMLRDQLDAEHPLD